MDDRPRDLLEPPKTNEADPLDMTGRLYRLASVLLDELESNDDDDKIKDRITCTKYLNDIVKQHLALKKATTDDDTAAAAGSAVRKYSKAFAKDAVSKRKAAARRAAALEPDSDDNTDDE